MIDSIVIMGELFTKKNNRSLGYVNNCIINRPSYNSNKADKYSIWQLLTLKKKWQEIVKNKEYPLRVDFKVYRRTKRIFDYINIVQGLIDCMTKAGYFPDDCMKYLLPSFSEWGFDKSEPRTIITVL